MLLSTNEMQRKVYAVMGTRAAPLLGKLRNVYPAPEKVPTLAISKDGDIFYNPDFLEEHCKEDEVALVTLMVHEFLHPLMRHHSRGEGKNPQIANVAQDAVINSTIAQMNWSQKGKFFDSFYGEKENPHPLEALLCSKGIVPPELPNMLEAKRACWERQAISSEEIYEAILKDMPPEEGDGEGDGEGQGDGGSQGEGQGQGQQQAQNQGKGPVVLGDHSDKSPSEELSPEQLLDRAEAAEGMLQEQGNDQVGKNGALMEIIAQIKNELGHLRKDSLYKWAIKRKFGKFVKKIQRPRVRTAPYVLNPSRMDVVKMGLRMPQEFYNNSVLDKAKDTAYEVVMYLDVSGSVGLKEIAEACSVISAFKFAPTEIYQFSTELHRVYLEELKKGVIKTTGGTDFEVVLNHAMENKHDRIVVFSDGQDSLKKVPKPPKKFKVFEVGYSSGRATVFPFKSAGYNAAYVDIEDLLK